MTFRHSSAYYYLSFVLSISLMGILVQQLVMGNPAKINDYDAVEVGGAGPDESHQPEGIQDPKAFCALPPKRGHCRALLLRWRYDPSVKDCVEFKFGGCDGNSNNFNTRKQCLKICEGV